jgi:hypothetical protein
MTSARFVKLHRPALSPIWVNVDRIVSLMPGLEADRTRLIFDDGSEVGCYEDVLGVCDDLAALLNGEQLSAVPAGLQAGPRGWEFHDVQKGGDS